MQLPCGCCVLDRITGLVEDAHIAKGEDCTCQKIGLDLHHCEACQ